MSSVTFSLSSKKLSTICRGSAPIPDAGQSPSRTGEVADRFMEAENDQCHGPAGEERQQGGAETVLRLPVMEMFIQRHQVETLIC